MFILVPILKIAIGWQLGIKKGGMKLKYVDIDVDGKVKGFYCDEVHSVKPETARPITDEAWKRYLENQFSYHDYELVFEELSVDENIVTTEIEEYNEIEIDEEGNEIEIPKTREIDKTITTPKQISMCTDIICVQTKEQYYIENPDKVVKPKPSLEERIAALEKILLEK